jgi:hypothetical protein
MCLSFLIQFFLYLALSINIAAEHPAISYAREFRLNPALSQEEEENRLKDLLEKTNVLLPHYEIKDGLKNCVKEFVDDNVSLKTGIPSKYTVVDARTTEFYGKSHDIVFLIKDNEGTICFVVKAFQNPHLLSGRLLPEISAMDLIQNMQLPGVTPIESIACGICHDATDTWGLLLESAAKGQRLDQYMHALGKELIGSIQRKYFLDSAAEAFARMGESLAQLHSRTSPEKLPLHPLILSKFDDKTSKILADDFIVTTLTEYFPVSQLQHYVQKVKNEAINTPLLHTYAHGDTNMGNIFYDPITDTITFIDLYAMHQTADIHGNPLGDPLIDLVRAVDGIRKTAVKEKLTEEETEFLIKILYSAYKRISGEIPSDVHIRFYKTYISLWRLLLGRHYIDEQDLVRREFDKATFDEGIGYLRTQLAL